jgi:hypothetical protein
VNHKRRKPKSKRTACECSNKALKCIGGALRSAHAAGNRASALRLRERAAEA